jgi:hypothetical protein
LKKRAGGGFKKLFKEELSSSGGVVIVSAYRTGDPGFESRQGVRFLVLYTLQCCSAVVKT